jgi:hypothetical protein
MVGIARSFVRRKPYVTVAGRLIDHDGDAMTR